MCREGTGKMGHVTSDSGNVLADLELSVTNESELETLSKLLDSVAGIVEHGIFLDQCTRAVVCTATGDIQSYSR